MVSDSETTYPSDPRTGVNNNIIRKLVPPMQDRVCKPIFFQDNRSVVIVWPILRVIPAHVNPNHSRLVTV